MSVKASDGSRVGHDTVRTRLGLLPMPALGVKCGRGPQAWSAVYPFTGPQFHRSAVRILPPAISFLSQVGDALNADRTECRPV